MLKVVNTDCQKALFIFKAFVLSGTKNGTLRKSSQVELLTDDQDFYCLTFRCFTSRIICIINSKHLQRTKNTQLILYLKMFSVYVRLCCSSLSLPLFQVYLFVACDDSYVSVFQILSSSANACSLQKMSVNFLLMLSLYHLHNGFVVAHFFLSVFLHCFLQSLPWQSLVMSTLKVHTYR